MNVGEIHYGDNIDQFVEIVNLMETLVVNGRSVTVKRGQHSKTILCNFCKQNQLNFPQYILTEELFPGRTFPRRTFHLREKKQIKRLEAFLKKKDEEKAKSEAVRENFA